MLPVKYIGLAPVRVAAWYCVAPCEYTTCAENRSPGVINGRFQMKPVVTAQPISWPG